uniref:AlNc14C681G12395 protein n=1 Tax=Albugo laibachii Nc14 TaxID=890382 RepID=F0X1T1_9STRA|nr:AlNc14C681G12395 [Albugo laibachii Nc14]|eukprot:CCA27784.1 AlNc14C681G12395 [Albugo laibachii Nc14]
MTCSKTSPCILAVDLHLSNNSSAFGSRQQVCGQESELRSSTEVSRHLQREPRRIDRKQKRCKEYSNGHMTTHAVFDEVEAKTYRYDIRHDAKGQICSLMFANPESIALAGVFYDVILLYCTH